MKYLISLFLTIVFVQVSWSQKGEKIIIAYNSQELIKVFTDIDELHGDRAFADDRAAVAGLARFAGEPVMVIGQQKGRDTRDK